MKRIIIFILSFVALVIKTNAQDPQFSQFYSSPLYLGPSLAGGTEQTRVVANYRSQWANLPKAFSTYAVSLDHYISKHKSGVGLLVLRDQEGGVYNSTVAGLSYSYTINVNHAIKVRPGLNASYYNRSIDYNELNFADELSRGVSSSIEIPKSEQINHYDFTFSLLTYTEKYWFGATGDHLLALNKQFAENVTYPDLKITLYGGARFKLYERVRSKVDKYFALSFLYKNQAGFNQLDFGTYYENGPLRIGVWFRGIPAFKETADLNAVVLLVGYTINDFMINYSYDVSTSRLLASTGGAHEISLAYVFDLGWNSRRGKMGQVPCPYF